MGAKQAMMLFEIEAWWDDDKSTVVRYVEAKDMRSALAVVPEESVVVRINMLGGLYKLPAKRART